MANTKTAQLTSSLAGSLSLFTNEIRGIVWIATSLILSHLRIRTERPGSIYFSAGEMRS